MGMKEIERHWISTVSSALLTATPNLMEARDEMLC